MINKGSKEKITWKVNSDKLIDITKLSDEFEIEIKYATENNLTGKKIYPIDLCALQEDTAWKLIAANKDFLKMGYRIKIWDGYRPYAVQKIFWSIMPDDRFIANPFTGGSIHSSGNAVDITLVDSNGIELEMPTEFDNFTEKATRDSKEMSNAAAKNLKVLTEVMIKHGFRTIDSEWWHYEDTNSRKHTYLDVPLERIAENKLLVEKLQCIAESTQVMIVTNEDRMSFKAKMNLYEKKSGKWLKVCPEMDANIGRNGFRPVKNTLLTDYDKQIYKHEGDGCSPIGAYTIDRLFGWGEDTGFDLPYTIVDDNDYWISDGSKEKYNIWMRKEGGPDTTWKIFERMNIKPYKYAGIINYNIDENRIVGNGSAIFLHLKTDSGYTAGCTAVSEQDFNFILKWMKKDKRPLWVGGPLEELASIR